MAKYTGDLVEVAIGKETTRGTAVAPSYGLKWTNLSFVDKTIMTMDESRSGIISDTRDSHVVGKIAEGEVEGPVRDRSFALILYSLMGTVNSAVVETTAYEHTLDVAETIQHQSLTFHKKDPNGAFDHALAVVGSLEFTVDPETMVSFKSNLRAKARSSQSRTVSYATENIFLPQHCSFKLASSQSGLDGASAINIRSAKLTVNQDVKDDRVLGSTDPSDIFNGQYSVECEIEYVQTADTYITALLAGTAYALRLDATNTDVTIGASTNPRVRFDLYRVKLQEAPSSYQLGDLTIQTLKFKAHYSETDSKIMRAYVRNLVASY